MQVTDGNGCTSSASAPVAVTVNSLPATPTITPEGATTFCQGSSVTLFSPASASYLWSTGASTQSIIAATSGNYTVQVTNVNGCTSASSAPVVVTVNSLPATPVITYSGSTSICQGSSITLTAPVGYYYSWSTGATTQSIPVNFSGSFTVQVTDGNNCTSAASSPVVVTVNPLPSTPTISAGGSTTFCEGGSVNLSAPAGYLSYNWSGGQSTQDISVTSSGNFSVQVTDNNNCTSNSSIPVAATVNSLPATPTVTTNGPVTFCQGANVTLTAPAGYTYLWSNSATTQSITVSINGTYTVVVTDGNGCQSLASLGVTVAVNAIPPTPVITQAVFTLTSDAVSGNQWYNSSGAITGATSQTYNATTDDTYYVIVTIDGCNSSQSNSIVVVGTGIDQANSPENSISIYPNPANNAVFIDISSVLLNQTDICIYSMDSKKLFAQKMEKAHAEIDISKFANGIYCISVNTGKNMFIKKLSVQH